ncbi:hypothetical protein CPT_Paku_001 [Burkholderia phage Paku]|uniref:Uncharacterized protein n=1 Tax=Burkholderia phage Paku TaxID=2859650 RepID=A0AAE7WMR5_9CAUD|nr:hypothetical protein CPT_Paku_001 [Burkholderia phage Paku]
MTERARAKPSKDSERRCMALATFWLHSPMS